MIIGLCADKREQIQRYVDVINKQSLKNNDDVIKVFTPMQLLFDVEEGFFDIEILVTDIYYDGLQFNGIDVSKKINEKYPMCQIIYSSRFVEMVDYTYETEYVYFIQKKNLEKLFGKAFAKARQRIEKSRREEVFEFFSEGVKRYIQIRDIYYIERNDRVVNIVTKDKRYKTSMSIKAICDHLIKSYIVRVNGSAAVNISHIRIYSGANIILDDLNEIIAVSPKYADNLSAAYIEYIEGK